MPGIEADQYYDYNVPKLLQESNFSNHFEQIRQFQTNVQGAEELRKLSRAIRPPKPVWVSGKANAVGQSSPRETKSLFLSPRDGGRSENRTGEGRVVM